MERARPTWQLRLGLAFVCMALAGLYITTAAVQMLRLIFTLQPGLSNLVVAVAGTSILLVLGIGVTCFTSRIGFHMIRSWHTGAPLPEYIAGPKNTTTEG